MGNDVLDRGVVVGQRIAVDVDGTLIRTDLLWESAAKHVLHTPWGWAQVIAWTASGKVNLKTRLAEHVDLDPALLPYKVEVVERLRTARADGAHLVMATAAARRYAHSVAEHLDVFDEVLATDPGGANMRSETKAATIDTHFGGEPWTYVGDSHRDLPVWDKAAGAIAVDISPMVSRGLGRMDIPVERLETSQPNRAKAWIKQLRIHQWVKNVLIFVPLLAAHLVFDIPSLLAAVLAFLSFSLVASSVYVWNDLSDLDADRRHKRKRNRPIAAGVIPVPQAVVAATLLAVGGFGLAFLVNWVFVLTLIGYAIATNLYSFWLKRKPMIDVTVLAMLYTWRIVAGCAAILVYPSLWLLAFSVFFFFGLALMKRYAELATTVGTPSGRGYGPSDPNLVMSLGVGSGLVSVLVATLYIDSEDVYAAYGFPEALWALVPLLLYWVARTWMVTIRLEMHDDPLVFAIRDRVSALVFAAIGAVWLVATVF